MTVNFPDTSYAMCYTVKRYSSRQFTLLYENVGHVVEDNRGIGVEHEREKPASEGVKESGVNGVCDADCESTEKRYCVYI